MKQEAKLFFGGIHKSYENCDSLNFRQNELVMDESLYIGFAILELIKLYMYETYDDKLQPYFRQENLQCQYMDSVTKDTPIMSKGNEIFENLRNDEIADEADWYVDNNFVTYWG